MSRLLGWFGDAGHAAFAVFFVAVASLVVSIIALRKGQSTQQRVLAIEEEREADRKRRALKAELQARIVKDERNNDWLEINNRGEAAATEVDVRLDGIPVADHPGVGVQQDELVQMIGPHSNARYLLILTMQECPPYEIAITWQDRSGEPGEYRTTLTF